MEYYIYYLLDPSTLVPYWCGQTVDLTRRFREHCWAKQSNEELNKWVVSLRPRKPVLRVVCVLNSLEEAVRLETALTRVLKSKGLLSLNTKSGLSDYKQSHTQRSNHRVAIREAWQRGCYGEHIRPSTKTLEGAAVSNARRSKNAIKNRIRRLLGKTPCEC